MEDSWRGLKSGFGRKIFPTRLHVRSARLARLHSLFLPVRLFLTKRRDVSPYFRSAKITGNIPRRRIWILGSVFERNHRIYGPRSITNCEREQKLLHLLWINSSIQIVSSTERIEISDSACSSQGYLSSWINREGYPGIFK